MHRTIGPGRVYLFQGYNQVAVRRAESKRKSWPWIAEKFPHMMHTDAVQATPATALAVFLDSAASTHKLSTYRGVLTPEGLDAPETEIAALATGAAVHDLGWQRRVAVRGEDRFRWLSGMVTNMVTDLPVNAGAWNLVLNAQGRIQGDLVVWRYEDRLELEIAADQCERLLKHLEHFIIMDDVELAPLNGEAAGEAGPEAVLGLTGLQANEVLGRLSLPTLAEPLTSTRVEFNGVDVRLVRGYGALVPHYEIWMPGGMLWKVWSFLLTAGAVPVGSSAVEAFRIAEGMPQYGVDIVERDLPQETSQIRALHFSKGCYLGQEIVERIRSRGNVHRHLRQLEIEGPIPASGTQLMLDGTQAGHITSAAELALGTGKRIFALGMMRAEAEVRNMPMSYEAGSSLGTARILDGPPKLG
jgi:folate-binding protein YgfZ